MDRPMGVSRKITTAARRELEQAGKLGSALGNTVLALASRLDAGADSASGMAAMAKELRTLMAALGAGQVMALDPVDDLKKRREQRRGA